MNIEANKACATRFWHKDLSTVAMLIEFGAYVGSSEAKTFVNLVPKRRNVNRETFQTPSAFQTGSHISKY